MDFLLFKKQSEISVLKKEIQDEFQKWHFNKSKKFKKTFLITSLIYLNIAALHHEGYYDFLFYYGKYLLSIYLNARENDDFFINKKLILIQFISLPNTKIY